MAQLIDQKGSDPKSYNLSTVTLRRPQLKQDDIIDIQKRLKARLKGLNLKKIIEQGGKSIELLINQEAKSKIDSFNRFYFRALRQKPGLHKKDGEADESEMFKGSFLY